MPLRAQYDGSFAAVRRDHGAASGLLVRFSHEPAAGLCVDALAQGDPPFSFDEHLLRSFSELNARLPHGAVALWSHPRGEGWLVAHRWAVPMPWLVGPPGRTLLTADTVAALLDNASGAWDDVIRIVRGGPVARP